MTAKEYLLRAREIEYQIKADMLEACRLRALAEKATGTFAATRVSGTSQRSKVEDAALELCALDDIIAAEIHDLVRAKNEIRETISSLSNPVERNVLRLRYLCGKKWEEIAVDTNYSWRQVHYIHGAALKNIAHYCTLLHINMC